MEKYINILDIKFFWDKSIACSLLDFDGKKKGKYKYYGKENISLAWDRIEVFKNHVRVYRNCMKVFEIVFKNHIRAQDY